MSNGVMNSADNLFTAVSKAAGRRLDISEFDDRLLVQKGCYILNRWGYGPMFDFNLYLHGPYSPELADIYYSDFNDEGSTNVSEEAIRELSEIMDQGLGYIEAYATLMLVRDRNPKASRESVLARTEAIKPHLKGEIERAAECLL